MAKKKKRKSTKKQTHNYSVELIGILLVIIAIIGIIPNTGVVGNFISNFSAFLVGTWYNVLLIAVMTFSLLLSGCFDSNGAKKSADALNYVKTSFKPSIAIWGNGERCFIVDGKADSTYGNGFYANAEGYTPIVDINGGTNNIRYNMSGVPCYWIAFR